MSVKSKVTIPVGRLATRAASVALSIWAAYAEAVRDCSPWLLVDEVPEPKRFVSRSRLFYVSTLASLV